jgi:RNA recognition motif-containing protein
MMDSSKKIFVGALEPSVTQKYLIDFFSKFGKVKEASVLFGNKVSYSVIEIEILLVVLDLFLLKIKKQLNS